MNVMLAILTHDHFYSNEWFYERKLDGERCIAYKNKNKVILKSRNHESLNVSYPELEIALKKIKIAQLIVDGEVVAFKGKTTSFSLLQERMHVSAINNEKAKHIKIYYYLFDILYLDGYDLTKLPLEVRKNILKNLCAYSDPLRYTPHRIRANEAYFNKICKAGWEGLVVKKKTSTYEQKRSSNWLKFKCSNEQEFVIGGYTQPGGKRTGFGALLLGYYKNNKLHYAGKVGTGFNEEVLEMLTQILKKRTSTKNPFVNFDDTTKNVFWVKPTLVCQIAFTEWTTKNKLRHPRYLGLRRDKQAKDVVKES